MSSPPPDDTPSSQLSTTSSKTLLENAEYMEDLEGASDPKPPKPAADASVSSTPTGSKTASKPGAKSSAAAASANGNGKKRQLNLLDMLGGSTGQTYTANKRQRTTSNASASSASSSASTEGGGAGVPRPPRIVNGLRPFNAIPFNMDAYKTSLSEEEKQLLALECETMGRTWLKVLANEIRKPYFLQLKRFLWKEGVQDNMQQSVGSPKIFPPPKDIYNWSRTTPLGRLRVVIIGQDPYHGPGQAHGLCFSVAKGVAVPPSLRNMYKEIASDYPGFVPPKHGDLTSWAEDGVLLINTSLTVRSGAAGSHAGKGWEEFTDAVIDMVDKYGGASLTKAQGGVGRGIVFLAWGAWAAKRVAKLSKTKHLILTSAHPSPLSASRGFFGNAHFRKTNEWLEQKYGAEARVNWTKFD